MIEQATCKRCGRPIEIKEIGPHKREYCDDKGACRQAAHRERKKAEVHQHNVAIERIAELEAALAQSEQVRDQVQEQLREYARTANEKVSELTSELARYRKIDDLFDHAKLAARFLALGAQVQYHPLTPQGIMGGYGYWQDFANRADNESLIKAIATAEEYLEGCIALRGDPREQRIAELERQVEVQVHNIESSEQYAAKLEAELARYRKIVDLSDRQGAIARFMLIGEEIGYKRLESVELGAGPHAWYTFSQQADDELLARGVVAAETKWKHQADLQTTTAVAKQEKIITDLRQKLRECEKRKQS